MLFFLNCLFLASTDVAGTWCQQLMIFYKMLLLQKLLLLQSSALLITLIFKQRNKDEDVCDPAPRSGHDQALERQRVMG